MLRVCAKLIRGGIDRVTGRVRRPAAVVLALCIRRRWTARDRLPPPWPSRSPASSSRQPQVDVWRLQLAPWRGSGSRSPGSGFLASIGAALLL